MTKTALVTGVRGQDGAYLVRHLLDQGYRVVGADRRSSDQVNWRLRELGVHDRIEYVYLDLTEITNMLHVIEVVQPDEFYNLAAQSFVSTSFLQPVLTSEVDGIGVLRCLEALKVKAPECRFYQASTSEMFGRVAASPQDESTPFCPRSPYGIAKLFAHWTTVNYRESYDMFCCSGILFNHESPLRGAEFVTRKITRTVAEIKAGLSQRLVLGNVAAKRDWGFAGDYVDGMWRMMQLDSADDFVLATGLNHSVEDFVSRAFQVVGINLEWEGTGVSRKGHDRESDRCLVECSPQFFRPAEVDALLGDASKAKRVLGWQPQMSFDQLVETMTEADCRRLKYERQHL